MTRAVNARPGNSRASRQRRAGGNELIIALAVVGALMLAVGLGAWWVRQADTEAAAEFAGETIASDNPITVTHDMGPSPRIPFLPAGDPQPNVEAPEPFYDFGRIGATDVVERTFLVRNRGEAPLTISKAYTTCGCTTAELSSDVIPPGQAITVRLIFDAGFHDAAGQTVRRGVILENNDPDQPQTEIWVQAEVGN